MCKDEGFGMARSVEYFGADIRNRTKKFRKKEDVSTDDWYRQESAGNSSEGLPEWLEDFAENFEIVEMPAAANVCRESEPEHPIKVAPRKHSPEKPKLQGLQANQDYKGSLQNAN